MDATQKLLRFGMFELNLDTEELRRGGTPLKLAPQPFRVLALLASHAGQIITREEIRKLVWGEETYVDFEHGLNQCIKQIRTALVDDVGKPMYIETIPRRGYRFIAPVTSKIISTPPPNVTETPSSIQPSITAIVAGASEGIANPSAASGSSGAAARATVAPQASAVAVEAPPAPKTGAPDSHWFRTFWMAGLALLFVAVGLYWQATKAKALTDKDTIVIADFSNSTGDPVFDGTLRQGLSAQLEQSPYLNLLSDAQITRTLALMSQPKDVRLTHEVVHDVCQRTGSAAMVEGSIDRLGSEYVLGLRAIDCRSGDVLAEEQETTASKEQVVRTLGNAAAKLRKKLGESLASVQKYDAPAENVTTASVEALQAYDLGFKAHMRSDFSSAITLFERATRLDPNFAMAYARLATSYMNAGESTRAAEAIRNAYELRDRTDERQKLYITGRYETLVTGDLDQARRTYELWAQTYPRDPSPLGNLYAIYAMLGNYDMAINAMLQALRLTPASSFYYSSLISGYTSLDRLDDAKAIVQQSRARNISAPILAQNLYMIDFVEHDRAAMERESQVSVGKPLFGDVMLQFQSDTAAYFGNFTKARELTQRAVQSALHNDSNERAALYLAESAAREAIAGNLEFARHQAKSAVALVPSKDVSGIAALAMALSGDTAAAARVAKSLDQQYPKDTIVQLDYLPMVRAAVALSGHNSRKTEPDAVHALSVATYELGNTSPDITFSLYPAYLRGQAFLAAGQGAEAAAQFRIVLGHPGVVLNQSIGALAHLGLGRALAASGDTAGAKSAYQDFLALWKDADRDIPALKNAKAEYAKL